ncbi:DUF551 domain-containing protein [Acinetobacter cumulans]|uniref:DUF551 domain-containing protein n=2 Tax=Acinetobacter cumulans TaxID=2136182 RepID=A0ABX9U474_9GAMM|nr:DUF551 domain-containing protein [Acinetobacter cumulans]
MLCLDGKEAQAVPDLGELQERIAGHQYYHDEHGHMIVDMDDVVKEISGFDSWKAQAVPGWVSVEDKLPIDGQDVIAFDAIKHCVFKCGEFLQGYIESDTGHEYEEPVEVTHWMAVKAQEQGHD